MSNTVALLVSFPNPDLKTECKFTCELSDTCQNTMILGGNFLLGGKDFFPCGRQLYLKKPPNNPNHNQTTKKKKEAI